MMRRVVLTVLSVTALLSGLLVGASPATAASVGTVTLTYTGGGYTLVPSEVAASPGDTFSFFNNGTTSNKVLRNATGSVSLPATPCTATDCVVANNATVTVEVVTAGTISIMDSNAINVLATLTITGGGSGIPDPALVYPTAYINANGGSCSGTLQFTKYNGQNGTITTPTSSTCARSGYTLRGWARSADALSFEWAPDATVPIGTDSFTLYAVWAANGVEVTYDANVGLSTPCLAGGVDVPTAAERRATTVVTPASSGQAVSVGADGIVRWTSVAPGAPCSPKGFTLAGWSTSPTGSVRAGGQANDIVTSGDGISPTGRAAPGSDRLTLYAVWTPPVYGITVTAESKTLSPGSFVTVTATATLNGAAAAGVPVAFGIPADSALTFGGGSDEATVTTNALGQATVTVVATRTGRTSVTGAYGDRTAKVEIEAQDAQEPSIVISGSRTTVSGKPGIEIDGVTTGLPAGAVVVPYFRFPGQTTFTAAASQRVVDEEGRFTWSRKTGKKISVYVEYPELGLRSNRVIIPAN